MEHFHYLRAVNYWLQRASPIFHTNGFQFLANKTEIFKKLLFALMIFARDISFAQQHEILNIVTGIIHQSPHCAIGHFLVGNNNGTHVQVNQFLHIFHFMIHGQFQPAEDDWYHFGSQIVVVMKCPAQYWVPTFRLWFPDIMK